MKPNDAIVSWQNLQPLVHIVTCNLLEHKQFELFLVLKLEITCQYVTVDENS